MNKYLTNTLLGLMLLQESMDKNIYNDVAKGDNKLRPKDIDVTPMPQRPPNGCKDYWFNGEGEFHNGGNKFPKTECVFHCYALNDKSAKKKFDNFKNLKT